REGWGRAALALAWQGAHLPPGVRVGQPGVGQTCMALRLAMAQPSALHCLAVAAELLAGIARVDEASVESALADDAGAAGRLASGPAFLLREVTEFGDEVRLVRHRVLLGMREPGLRCAVRARGGAGQKSGQRCLCTASTIFWPVSGVAISGRRVVTVNRSRACWASLSLSSGDDLMELHWLSPRLTAWSSLPGLMMRGSMSLRASRNALRASGDGSGGRPAASRALALSSALSDGAWLLASSTVGSSLLQAVSVMASAA